MPDRSILHSDDVAKTSESGRLCPATRSRPWCERCAEFVPPFPSDDYRLPCERSIADDVEAALRATP